MVEYCAFCHLVVAPHAPDRRVHNHYVYHHSCFIKEALLRRSHVSNDVRMVQRSVPPRRRVH